MRRDCGSGCTSRGLLLVQAVYPPVISNCAAPRAVPERSAPGTVVSPIMSASVSSVNTAITWAFLDPPPGLPLSIGFCDGQIKVLTPMTWATAPSYSVTVQATNDGTSIGLGKAFSACSVVVDIVQVPLPPVVTTTVFFVSELLPIGWLICDWGAACQHSAFLTPIPASRSLRHQCWAALCCRSRKLHHF